MKAIGVLTAVIFLILCENEVHSQGTNECAIFLKNPVFTSATTNSSVKSKENFRLLQCSASWKSASDAQAAGISATIPIYNIPVPFSANWDQTKVDQWKNQNCSQNERNANYQINFYQSIYSIDPISAKAGLECMRSKFAAEDTRAIRCNLTQTDSALLFQAEWRRTNGEAAGAAPIVQSFTAVNTVCQNANDLSPTKSLSEGGISLLCSVQKDAAAFSLNTSRGECLVSAAPRLPKIVLPKSMVMDKPLFIAGTDIEIPSDAKIVTNGYPLTINADRLAIDGQAAIMSFVSGPVSAQAAGRFSGTISITAKEVTGKGLSILNAGEPGGVGVSGAAGAPGAPGGPGQTRLPSFQQNCGGGILNVICQAVPAGCTGGQNGGVGSPGQPGYQGNPGAPGGGAGEVTLDVPIDARDSVSILTDVDLAGKAQQCNGQICGGMGGTGGPGGPGGSGGPGGPGASGTQNCGGTNAGPNGPPGSTGPNGGPGSNGPSAPVRIL